MDGKDEPRRIKVIKGLGTRIKYHPPKRTEGLQRRVKPAPTNTPDRNGKAQEDAQSNHEQD